MNGGIMPKALRSVLKIRSVLSVMSLLTQLSVLSLPLSDNPLPEPLQPFPAAGRSRRLHPADKARPANPFPALCTERLGRRVARRDQTENLEHTPHKIRERGIAPVRHHYPAMVVDLMKQFQKVPLRAPPLQPSFSCIDSRSFTFSVISTMTIRRNSFIVLCLFAPPSRDRALFLLSAATHRSALLYYIYYSYISQPRQTIPLFRLRNYTIIVNNKFTHSIFLVKKHYILNNFQLMFPYRQCLVPLKPQNV